MGNALYGPGGKAEKLQNFQKCTKMRSCVSTNEFFSECKCTLASQAQIKMDFRIFKNFLRILTLIALVF